MEATTRLLGAVQLPDGGVGVVLLTTALMSWGDILKIVQAGDGADGTSDEIGIH